MTKMRGATPSKVFSFRMDDEEKADLIRISRKTKEDISGVLRRLIQQEAERVLTKRGAPGSEAVAGPVVEEELPAEKGVVDGSDAI